MNLGKDFESTSIELFNNRFLQRTMRVRKIHQKEYSYAANCPTCQNSWINHWIKVHEEEAVFCVAVGCHAKHKKNHLKGVFVIEVDQNGNDVGQPFITTLCSLHNNYRSNQPFYTMLIGEAYRSCAG